jgi:hypothetical protein
MPVGCVLVCDTGCHIEHDDTALSVDVVTIAKTTKLLLSSGIPDIELDLSQVLSHILELRPVEVAVGAVRTVVNPRG